MPKNYRPRSIRNLLRRKDFLSSIENGERLREKAWFVYLAGTKASGKTSFSDIAFTELQKLGWSVCSTRASHDADPILTDYRRTILARQERSEKVKWYDIVDALKGEGRSALERTVLPFLKEKPVNHTKGKIVLLNRYPLPDTLARQYLQSEISLEGIAQRLRGTNNEPACYIAPDLTIVFTCDGIEAIERIIRRSRPKDTELGVLVGSDFAHRITQQIEAYQKICGYNPRTKTYDRPGKALPGECFIVDTTTRADYSGDQELLIRDLKERESISARMILDEKLLPLIEENGNK